MDATHPLGGCTNPANATQVANCQAFQPVISFDAGSGPTSLLDTGHVLDTFGYDLINLAPPGGDGNESINWNLVGTVATRGGGGNIPEPSSGLLFAVGLAAIAFTRRRHTNKQRVP